MLAIFAMPYLYLRLSPIISGYILIHYTKRTMQSLCLCIHVYLLRFPHFHINMNVKWYRTICIVNTFRVLQMFMKLLNMYFS